MDGRDGLVEGTRAARVFFRHMVMGLDDGWRGTGPGGKKGPSGIYGIFDSDVEHECRFRGFGFEGRGMMI